MNNESVIGQLKKVIVHGQLFDGDHEYHTTKELTVFGFVNKELTLKDCQGGSSLCGAHYLRDENSVLNGSKRLRKNNITFLTEPACSSKQEEFYGG